MILSRRIALGGAQLDELDERIVIKSVDPGLPNETLNAVSKMGGFGQRVTTQHWNTLDVNVTFGIDIPKHELAERRAVFDLVTAWALKKGWLTVNFMEGKRAWIEKAILPAIGDPWDWMRDYTITFRAYSVPFWQDAEPTETSKKTVTSGNLQVTVGGTADSVLDIDFRNVSGKTIQNFSVSAGGKTLTLSGVNLTASETLKISHANDGILRAKAGTRNVYSLLTGDDDLVVSPGTVTVSVTASRAGDLTVRNYGRYL